MAALDTQRRRIAIVTGTRAEYGLLRSTMQALQAHPSVELQVLATGMHLLQKFGNTVRQITADGFRVFARVPMQRGDDRPIDQAEGLGRGVEGIARAYQRGRAHIAVVLGDRIEAMAGALAAAATGVKLAHIHGGDVAPGDFDGRFRDAITQLADYHFTASARATRRVLRLRADAKRIWNVGAPGLDRIAELLREHHPKKPSGCALVAQHAYGRSAAVEERVMTHLLEAVRAAGLRRVIIHPNSDRGHRGILAAINRHVRQCEQADVELHRSLPRDQFLRLLIDADLLVGNSSCAFIEAPFAGTVAIDVGLRQHGREAGGPGLLHAAESRQSIRAALQRASRFRLRPGARTVYGDGRAGKRIAARLSRLALARNPK